MSNQSGGFIKFVIAAIATITIAAGLAIAAAQTVVQQAQRAVECAVGGTVLAPLNITIEGIKLTDNIIDGAIDLGGDLLGGIGGVIGIGGGSDSKWSLEQLENAATITGVGMSRGESQRVIQIALMTSMQEASLMNINYGDRDSLGLFQQRPSQGWGTPEEIMDPVYAANAFYSALHNELSDQQINSLPMWEVAALVQRPQEDLEIEYDKWKDDAFELVTGLVEGSGGVIAIIGDSLTVGMQSSFVLYLEQSGWSGAVVDAASGRLIATDTERTPSGLSTLQTYMAADQDPILWVFDLGVHDVEEIEDVESAGELIDSLLAELPEDAHAAWVNVSTPGIEGGAFFNEALQERADESDKLAVVDWDGFVTETPGLRLEDGTFYTSRGYDQRAAYVSRVITSPTSFGLFSDGGFDPFGFISGFQVPGACDFGGGVLDGALDLLSGQIGLPFMGGNGGDGEPTDSLFDWAFAQSGENLEDLINSGDRLPSFNDAQIGDLVLWADDQNNPEEVTRTGIYLGANMVVMEPAPGELTTISRMDWASVQSVIRVGVDVFDQAASAIPAIEQADTVMSAGFRVHPALAARTQLLVDAASEAGYTLGGSAWRSPESQISLRRQHCGTSQYDIYEKPSGECSPPTAIPGSSMHERGLAFDFTCNGVSVTSRDSDCFRWLNANAEQIAGLKNLPDEPWHWSTNGS